MLNNEMETCVEKLHKGMQMILDKAEQIGKEEPKWSLDEVMMMSDITKDMSEVLKNIAKTHSLMEGHSVKRY